jgi:hypothetical protein
MAYRDERDAMRERLDVLEHDLTEAKRTGEHAAELEHALEAKERELAELRRQLEVLKQSDPGSARPRAVVIAAAAGTFVLVASAVALVALRRPKPDPAGIRDEPPAPSAIEAPVTTVVPMVRTRIPRSAPDDHAPSRATLCKLEVDGVFCYGFPVGPHVVLTAGSCLTGGASYGSRVAGPQRIAEEADLRCPVRRRGELRHKTRSTRLRLADGWQRLGDPAYRYGAILLEPSEAFDPAQVLPLTKVSDQELGSGHLGVEWSLGDPIATGTLHVTSTGPRELTFKLETRDRINSLNEGTPILLDRAGSVVVVGMGMGPPFGGTYSGLRVTAEMLQDVERWAQEW